MVTLFYFGHSDSWYLTLFVNFHYPSGQRCSLKICSWVYLLHVNPHRWNISSCLWPRSNEIGCIFAVELWELCIYMLKTSVFCWICGLCAFPPGLEPAFPSSEQGLPHGNIDHWCTSHVSNSLLIGRALSSRLGPLCLATDANDFLLCALFS